SYDTTHKDFENKFPLDSAARKDKLQAYLLSYKNSTTMLVKSMSGQEKSIDAALRVCWTLNKHQKPFTDSEIVKELPKSSLQMEIIDLQEDISLQMNKTSSTKDFWIKHVLDKYINCKTLAIKLATMFGFTYVCETSFSNMSFLKNQYRSRLTNHHLENTLRIKPACFIWIGYCDSPTLSPDLALSDYHLFNKFKNFLGEQLFSNDEEVQDAVKKWLREVERKVYDEGIQKLVPRLKKCIDLNGDLCCE
ncbi:Hypothetical protein CINCED_3A018601, partial [Cinara cedri]